MQVTLEVPEDLVRLLGESPASLTRAALEALALEGLRSGKISVAQARRLLGVGSRYEMDGFLKAHEIFLSLTAEDVKRDAAAARAFRPK
jgi:predicted HTH domain antitoxin